VIVTSVPVGPDVGEKRLISGVTLVVIRPIELLGLFVNHMAPSGPVTMSSG
jgi:hypothetical protein